MEGGDTQKGERRTLGERYRKREEIERLEEK